MLDVSDKIGIVETSLADLEVDALVTETDTSLRLATGTSVAIKQRLGAEYEQRIAAFGPIALGETVAVEGGRLWARSVILCAIYAPGHPPTEASVSACIGGVFKRADEIAAESLALPLLGVGPGGVGVGWCAGVVARFTVAALRHGFYPQRAVLVAADRAMSSAIERAVAAALAEP